MWDQWFAWHPIKIANRTVWLEGVWRFRDGAVTRYLIRYEGEDPPWKPRPRKSYGEVSGFDLPYIGSLRNRRRPAAQ
jgi:hypothetical protein